GVRGDRLRVAPESVVERGRHVLLHNRPSLGRELIADVPLAPGAGRPERRGVDLDLVAGASGRGILVALAAGRGVEQRPQPRLGCELPLEDLLASLEPVALGVRKLWMWIARLSPSSAAV